MKNFLNYAILFLLFSTILFPQGSFQYRRAGVLDVNNIKTVFSNYGVVAQPSQNNPPRGAWKYEQNGYFGDFSFVIGLELPIRDYNGDGVPDTLHAVTISPVSRPGGGKVNQDGSFCGFEPVPGFFSANPPTNQSIALSDIPSTWPSSWPDHPEYPANTWNGLLGANSFIPGREAFFVVDDTNEKRKFEQYGFLPDSTNPARKGYGLDVKVRIIQSTIPELQDALIFVYEIKNNSKYTYNKMVFGEVTGSYIGITGSEWDDDYTILFNKDDMVMTGDFDNKINKASNPYWTGHVGKYGNTFIQSPGNQKIGSFCYCAPSNNIQMANDEHMWLRLKPGSRSTANNVLYGNDSIPKVFRGEDGDNMYGTHSFSLNPGEVKRIASVIAYGDSQSEIYYKILCASALYHNNFDKVQAAGRISLTSHMNNPEISGTSLIEWQSAAPNTGSVDIYYSGDKGVALKNIVYDAPNTGSFSWNTLLFEDSKFGAIYIVLKDTEGNKIAVVKSKYFTVNNVINGSPYLSINNILENQEITTTLYNLNIHAADPENNSLNLKLYAKNANTLDSILILDKTVISDTSAQTITLNIGLAPNANGIYLTGYLFDGLNYKAYSTWQFNKQTETGFINSSNYGYISGKTSVHVKIRIADSSLIKSHSYTITFDDTSSSNQSKKYYSVWNNDRQVYTLQHKLLNASGESEMFDGMYFQSNDFITNKDTARSKWHSTSPDTLPFVNFAPISIGSLFKIERSPKDYMFVFSDSYTNSSDSLENIPGLGLPIYTKLNYKVYDISQNPPERIQFALSANHNGPFDTLSNSDNVVLSDKEGNTFAWLLNFSGSTNCYIPKGGDTLFFYTNKGLSIYDTLLISNLTVGVRTEPVPVSYEVSQNYPNPFNPSTTVRYAVPQRSTVNIQVFNTLGQLIKTVINAEQQPGTYSAALNMQGFASGIYFYRVTIGTKVATKKMLLLK